MLDRWRSGDQQAGRDLFARYFDPLFRFFGTKCTEPDELIQTTFLAIVKSKDQFGGRSSFRTYLFTIARNQLYRHMRELKHNALFDPNLSSVAELATSVGSRLARHFDHQTLFAALRTLSIEQQTLVELHYWEDLDAIALGEIFDAPPPTIRMRLTRARVALREAIAAAGVLPDAVHSDEELDKFARNAGTVARKR